MNYQTIQQHKKEICEIGHRIWQKGFCAGNEGNHSVRVGPGQYLVTPTGISKGFLEPADILLVDDQSKIIETNARGRKPSSEFKVHLAIYQARADVGAVVHSHPPHATAFAIAGIAIPEGIHPEAEVFLGKVKTAPYATPSTPDLPNSLLPLIDQNTNTLLMGNHGSVNFDRDLISTYYKLEILDAYCRILLLTKQIGKVNVLNPSQLTELLEVKKKFGMSDERLACAPEGCIGGQNDEFLTTFDVRPATASCACNGGAVTCSCNPPGGSDDQFDTLARIITDQILAGTVN